MAHHVAGVAHSRKRQAAILLHIATNLACTQVTATFHT